jgi:hypothetical protein
MGTCRNQQVMISDSSYQYIVIIIINAIISKFSSLYGYVQCIVVTSILL